MESPVLLMPLVIIISIFSACSQAARPYHGDKTHLILENIKRRCCRDLEGAPARAELDAVKIICRCSCRVAVADHVKTADDDQLSAMPDGLQDAMIRAMMEEKEDVVVVEAAADQSGTAASMIDNSASAVGSKPPNCVGKCSTCKPCTPVKVSVQPGNPTSGSEYYPEAWRCKCAGKLYMP